MLYGSETWRVKEKDVIRPGRNDAWTLRWMCMLSRRIEFLYRNIRRSEYLQDRMLQRFGHLERMEEKALYSRCR